MAKGNQSGGFYLTFSIVTVICSVVDDKANGHRPTPRRSTIDTRAVNDRYPYGHLTTFGLTA